MPNESSFPCTSVLCSTGALDRIATRIPHRSTTWSLWQESKHRRSTVFNSRPGCVSTPAIGPAKRCTREGWITHADKTYRIDRPAGTYSCLSASYDEEIARNFVLFGQPDVTFVVVDANRLDANLNLALQFLLEITDQAWSAWNLIDEATAYGLAVDAGRLAEELGFPSSPPRTLRGGHIPSSEKRSAGWQPAGSSAAPPPAGAIGHPRAGWRMHRLPNFSIRSFPACRTADWGLHRGCWMVTTNRCRSV